MHEGAAPGWLEVVEKHYSALVDDLATRVDSDVKEAVKAAVAAESSAADARAEAEIRRACEDARRSQAESLNQGLRRIRTCAVDNVLTLLAEGCAPLAERLVVLVFESNQSGENQARRAAGVEVDNFDIENTPAIITAIETRDPVVAIASDGELSATLAGALRGGDDAPKAYLAGDDKPKAYLFPVVARQSVMAMLVASGVELSAPIELLCGAAGMRLETPGHSEAPSKAEPLVQVAAGVPASETFAARSWDELTPEDQALHLQAQRMARVRVAEMRVDHSPELQRGAIACDIYGSLQSEIDAARSQFLQTFLSKSPTMVDYLHLEILRSLAHGDERMLGHNYPGPMV
jgi:hypothetical protein